MTHYSCLIVDDEPIAVEIIETYINDLNELHVAGTSNNALEALEFLKDNPVDLLFLDIEMPRINGLQLLSALKNKPEVILTTAYRYYAVESYEHEVLDYLLKPISFERFLKAIDKFYRKMASLETESDEILQIKVDKHFLHINVSELLYIEGASDYVKIHTQHKTYITYEKMSNLEVILTPKGFVRIHKSYMVALNRIVRYSWQEVVLGDVQLPVGRRFKENLMGQLRKNKLMNKHIP